MRRILFVAGFCAASLMASSQPGVALDRGQDVRNRTASDLSAAKKKKQQYVYLRKNAQPNYAARRGWTDPSLGPDGRPYPNPYPPGTCSVDLGYGRFGNCDFHE